MRYVTFSTAEDRTPRLGVLDGSEVVGLQSLSGPGSAPLPERLIDLIEMGPEHWERVAGIVRTSLSRREGVRQRLENIRWHPPLLRPARNIFCLGLNYASHAAESAAARGRDVKLPQAPVFFTKASTAVNGPFDDVVVDRTATQQVDWEVELGVIVGVGGKNITRHDALRHVFGYTVINDVTARDLQARHLQWFKGKSLDGFAPMGPCVVTADEFGSPQAKRVTLRVNGIVKQDASTKDMIFPVDEIIATLSHGLTIEPGDIIASGTPEGVGMGRTPPEFLNDGDVVEAQVEGIGTLKNTIRG